MKEFLIYATSQTPNWIHLSDDAAYVVGILAKKSYFYPILGSLILLVGIGLAIKEVAKHAGRQI